MYSKMIWCASLGVWWNNIQVVWYEFDMDRQVDDKSCQASCDVLTCVINRIRVSERVIIKAQKRDNLDETKIHMWI